ncbi:hypothetical protein Tco_1057538 [Tanacetum coccineum]|uniref:Uncharacterized protein n=1 Tax=Tanacetum coccineum TaxID=301880 RepID=A0ABQ5H5S5_9ASTR
MDDPNITMEEYIRLEEEKARRRGKVYNWETATYGKIWYDEDVHDLRSVETEFPAIVFNDKLTSEEALSCEPTVSPLNDNEIDFRISFDESDDEDYTVIYDKNSFSYKIISVNDLKTDSENDNDKVNMPSFPSPEPTVSYFDDLDFFKDFENEFPAIVYNDALTSKLDFLTEPTVSPQHIDEFNLKDETSLSECDEEEQNVLYLNDEFPFNVVYPDDSKSDKDNDDDKIDIKQSLRNFSVKPLPDVINTDDGSYAHASNKLLEASINTAYPGEWIRRIDFLYSFSCLVGVALLVKDCRMINYYYSEDQYVVSIKEDTAYPCLHSPKTTKDKAQYVISRETQYAVFKIWNEYNILEDIKRGPYSKKSPIRYVHNLESVETEFPAIVFNNTLTPEALLCEPVSSLNNDKIDFRISFDESEDEDCMVIFDKNSFSYKIISINDLKTDSENDNEKVNMPLLPLPEPTVSYFDDLDFFKDFEKEFPAIVYNDAQTSKLDFLTEPTLSPQHIDEFNLKDETSLSECDEEEQNVLYFNDVFPFNVIYPDD